MLYPKNLPAWERALRLVLGAAIAAAGFIMPVPLLVLALLAATGVTLALTAAFGFCPMCALAGRRLRAKAP